MAYTIPVLFRASALLTLGMGLIAAGSLPVTAQSRHTSTQSSLHTLSTRPVNDNKNRDTRDDKKTDKKDNKGDDKKDPNDKTNPFGATTKKVDGQEWGVVAVNDKEVMGIPVEAGKLTPFKRAQVVAERMDQLYQAGAKFRLPEGYVVAKLHGEIVLGLRSTPDKAELLFTIDGNLERLLKAHNKDKRITRVDIAVYWRDLLIKAITEQTEIGTPMAGHDDWAKIPAGYAHNMNATPLRDSQVQRPIR